MHVILSEAKDLCHFLPTDASLSMTIQDYSATCLKDPVEDLPAVQLQSQIQNPKSKIQNRHRAVLN